MPDAQELQPPPRQRVARLVCGRRSKWVVVVLWLAVMMLAFPLAQKLTNAQDNDASSWLPGSTESTQVLQESEEFRPEVIPAIVVYARAAGAGARGGRHGGRCPGRRLSGAPQDVRGVSRAPHTARLNCRFALPLSHPKPDRAARARPASADSLHRRMVTAEPA